MTPTDGNTHTLQPCTPNTWLQVEVDDRLRTLIEVLQTAEDLVHEGFGFFLTDALAGETKEAQKLHRWQPKRSANLAHHNSGLRVTVAGMQMCIKWYGVREEGKNSCRASGCSKTQHASQPGG